MSWLGKKAADVIVSGQQLIDSTITAAKLVANAVTYAKMQQVSAGKVLGRDTSGSGNVQELPIAVASSGAVGIGITPYYKLDISGVSRVNFDTSGTDVVVRAMNPAGSVNVNLYHNALSHTWQLSGGTNMALDQNGTFYLNAGFGSAGRAYGCRAWVNFNGQGTVAIRGSGNVSSITDNGTGNYTANFTTAMPDANYCYAASGYGWWSTAQSLTASGIQINTFAGSGFANTDVAVVPVAIFR